MVATVAALVTGLEIVMQRPVQAPDVAARYAAVSASPSPSRPASLPAEGNTVLTVPALEGTLVLPGTWTSGADVLRGLDQLHSLGFADRTTLQHDGSYLLVIEGPAGSGGAAALLATALHAAGGRSAGAGTLEVDAGARAVRIGGADGDSVNARVLVAGTDAAAVRFYALDAGSSLVLIVVTVPRSSAALANAVETALLAM